MQLNKKTKNELLSEIKKLQRKIAKYEITEGNYKKTSREIQRSETGFRALFENTNDGIFLMDNDKFIDCNKRTLELFGCKRNQIIGQSPYRFSPEKQPDGSDSKELAKEKIKQALKGKSLIFEWRHTRLDNTIFDTEVSLTKIEFSGNDYILAIVRDISERKKADLIQSAIYRIAEATISARNLDDLFVKIHQTIGTLIPANNFFIALYDPVNDLFEFPCFIDEYDENPGPIKLRKSLTEYVFRTNQPLYANKEIMKELENRGEIGVVGTDSEYWIGIPLRTNEKSIGVLAVQSYHKDVVLTIKDKDILVFVSSQIAMAINRVRTENALKESEERYRTLYNGTPVMLQSIDKDNNLISVSNYWLKMLGYEREEVLGKKFFDFLTEDSRSYTLEFVLPKYIELGYISDAPHQFIKKNNEIVDVLLSAIPILDNSGDIVFSLAVLIDITKKRKIERALEVEKIYFEELFQNAPEAIVLVDMRGLILRVNREFTNLFGYTEKEVTGKNIDTLLADKELLNEANEITRSASMGNKVSHETVRKKKDGSFVHVSILASPISIGEEQLAVFGVYRDITIRKQAEENIQKYSKELESLNRDKDKFFSIVAHDLKSPFTALLGYSEVIAQDYDELSKDEIKEYAININDVAKNVNDLLSNLLDWSRIQTGRLSFEPEKVNLFEITQRVSSLFYENAKRKSIQILSEILEKYNVYADRNMIYTVLRNLTSNALKFTPKGGKIIIRATNQNAFIAVSVKDTGLGISQEDLNKIFKSSIHYSSLGTDKEQGTGLGLMLCKEMITKHGGEINVTSELGKGSTFTFTIPEYQNG